MKIPTKTGRYTEIDDRLFNFVKDIPKARERKHKVRTVAYLLQQRFKDLEAIPLDRLEKYLKTATTLSRQWRKLLEEKPEYRGNDYNRKKKIVENQLKVLGYKV